MVNYKNMSGLFYSCSALFSGSVPNLVAARLGGWRQLAYLLVCSWSDIPRMGRPPCRFGWKNRETLVQGATPFIRDRALFSTNFIKAQSHEGTMADEGVFSELTQTESGLKEFARWFKPTLLSGEKIESTFDLGFWRLDIYTIFATNQRLIVVKRFPKSLMEVHYEQIELLEYYTDIEWVKGLYAFFGFMLTFMFWFNRSAIMQGIYNLVGSIEKLSTAVMIGGIPAGEWLVFFGMLCVSLYFIGLFVLSLFGQLRILLYEQAPFDITTELTPQIQQLIMLVDEKKAALAKKKP